MTVDGVYVRVRACVRAGTIKLTFRENMLTIFFKQNAQCKKFPKCIKVFEKILSLHAFTLVETIIAK